MKTTIRHISLVGLILAASACTDTQRLAAKEAIQEPLSYWSNQKTPVLYDEAIHPDIAVGNQSMPVPFKEKTIHFGFDQSKLNSKTQKLLTQIADDVLEHPDFRLRIEGHTDERGSREYNIGLGWRRAHAVVAYLVKQGVNQKNIDAVSFGKEHPLDKAHNVKAWSKNRRVDVALRQDAS